MMSNTCQYVNYAIVSITSLPHYVNHVNPYQPFVILSFKVQYEWQQQQADIK